MAFVRILPLVAVDPSLPIAGFDLDHTLIKPIKNKVFPKDRDDWQFISDLIVPRLTKISKTHRVVVFTNQGEKRFNKEDFEYKIRNIQESLPFLEVRISHGKDKYRKPDTGMWSDTISEGDFYVGDAAGRSGDFSNSDLLFAKNLGIKFYTPEEFFDTEVAPATEQANAVSSRVDQEEAITEPVAFNYPVFDSQHVICLMGYQASGKSTFSQSLVDDHPEIVWLGNDEDKKKVIRKLKSNLNDSKTCIIDRTNPSSKDRAEWIAIAESFDVPIRLVYFTSSKNKAKLRNSKRDKTVPTIAFNMYGSKFEEPSVDEGFLDITRFEIPDL